MSKFLDTIITGAKRSKPCSRFLFALTYCPWISESGLVHKCQKFQHYNLDIKLYNAIFNHQHFWKLDKEVVPLHFLAPRFITTYFIKKICEFRFSAKGTTWFGSDSPAAASSVDTAQITAIIQTDVSALPLKFAPQVLGVRVLLALPVKARTKLFLWLGARS